MSEIDLRKRYRLIFSVFNTFFSLTTREEQERCFSKVARHLEPDGSLLLQTFYPNLALFPNDQRISIGEVSQDRAILDLSRLERAEQRTITQRVVFGKRGCQVIPIQVRFAWPKELDQMARKAGLRLMGRWDGWEDEPFTANPHGSYVSVWRPNRALNRHPGQTRHTP
jgi:hypothetical protein